MNKTSAPHITAERLSEIILLYEPFGKLLAMVPFIRKYYTGYALFSLSATVGSTFFSCA